MYNNCSIYKLKCLQYIGQIGQSLLTRYNEHISAIKHKKHFHLCITHIKHRTHLQKYLKHYGNNINSKKRHTHEQFTKMKDFRFSRL